MMMMAQQYAMRKKTAPPQVQQLTPVEGLQDRIGYKRQDWEIPLLSTDSVYSSGGGGGRRREGRSQKSLEKTNPIISNRFGQHS